MKQNNKKQLNINLNKQSQKMMIIKLLQKSALFLFFLSISLLCSCTHSSSSQKQPQHYPNATPKPSTHSSSSQKQPQHYPPYIPKQFTYSESLYKKYLSLKIKTSYKNPQLFWKVLYKKTRLFNNAKWAYLKLRDNEDWAVVAFSQLGELYLHYAMIFYRPPVIGLKQVVYRSIQKYLKRKKIASKYRAFVLRETLKKLFPERLKSFRLIMLKKGNLFVRLAIKYYKRSLTVAKRLQVKNKWTLRATKRLKQLKYHKIHL